MPTDRRQFLAHKGSWLLLGVLGLSLLLNLVPFWWGLPGPHGWAFDEIRPNHLKGTSTWPPKYPPLHRHVLRLTRKPVHAWESLRGLPHDDIASYSRVFLVNRLVSVLMATAIVYLTYRSARTLLPRYPSMASAATVACMPPFVYYAKTANLDTPYLFWFSLSLLFLLKALARYKLRDVVLFATFGALSICTKDQAYGLYLLAPLAVTATLWPQTSKSLSVAGRLRQAIFSRAVGLGALAAAAVAFFCYRVFYGPAEVLKHVTAATGPRTFSVVTETPSGALSRLWFTLQQVEFALGLPLFLLAIVGAVFSFRRLRRQTVALAALAAGYYLGFLIVLPYQTVRYLLPVSIMGSLFVGAALTWLPFGNRRWPLRLLVVAIFAFSLTRASWVDRSMLQDSRYAVEEWLDERARPEEVLGLGRPLMMPRNVAASAFENLTAGGCSFFERTRPRYLVIPTADLRGERETDVLSRLSRGDYGYDEVLRWRTPVRFQPRDLSRLLSNLDKVNPQIVVFERTTRPCLDQKTLPRALEHLREAPDRQLRSRLLDAVATWDLSKRIVLDGDAAGLAYGLRFDRWTRGTAPAAVVVRNASNFPARPVLRLGCLARAGDLPVIAHIDDGSKVDTLRFDSAGQLDAVLSVLGPGESRLLLVWADREWQPAGIDSRLLGVSVLAARLVTD